jgi:hypothetical protein
MKTNQFREMLRKIIAEEVKKELTNVLPQLLYEIMGPTPESFIEKTENIYVKEPKKEPKKELKRYAADPVLNKILNETAPLRPTAYGNSVAELADGGFNKIGESNEPINEAVVSSAGSADLSILFKNPTKLGNILKKSQEKVGGGGTNISGLLQNW